MDQFIEVNFKIIYFMGKESSIIQMEMYIKVAFFVDLRQDMEFTNILREIFMKDITIKTLNKERESFHL